MHMFSNHHPANEQMTYVANNYEFIFVIKYSDIII